LILIFIVFYNFVLGNHKALTSILTWSRSEPHAKQVGR